MLISNRRVLLFPVETIARELDFRLVLAALCANDGNQIILGNHTDVYELGKQLEDTLYVGKNLVNTSPTRLTECYEHLKDHGCRFIHVEEEGAIFFGDENNWRNILFERLDPHWLRGEDQVLTWGDFQRDYYRSLEPACADHIETCGHPRLNLSHPFFKDLYQDEIDALRSRLGPFILVNTNFNFGNHGLSLDNFLRKNGITPEQRELRDFYLGFYAHAARKVPAFIDLANHLMNEFPEHRLVLRPHPGENFDPYRTMLKYIPRASVEHSGSLNAWLHACDYLVHSGCTTGIEGYISGARVINYQPYPNAQYTHYLPNLVGVQCGTKDEVVDAIRRWEAGEQQTILEDQHRPVLRHLLENLDESRECFERMAAFVAEREKELPVCRVSGDLGPHANRGRKEKFKAKLKAAAPFYKPNLSTRRQYLKVKFPGLDPESIRAKLDVIERLFDVRVEATFHSSKLMTLAKANR